MSLEAQIAEQLQELKKWQQQQEAELIRKQQEQRQKLSSEQSRMFEALSSSIDEISLDKQSLQKLIKEQKRKQEDGNLIDFDAPDDECNALQRSRDCSETDLSCTVENNEDSISETPRGQLSFRNGNGHLRSNTHHSSSFSRNNTSTDIFSEDMPSFCSERSQKSLLIDDIPVPSPKKDFSTLLEEKLKDFETVQTENATKPVIKRPFLKKGQGLARFKPNPNNNRTPKIRCRSASFTTGTQSSESKLSKPVYLGRCNSLPKSKKCDTKKNVSPANPKKAVSPANVKKAVSPGNTRKAVSPCMQNNATKSVSPMTLINKKPILPLPSVVQTRLNLKNVPAPQKKIFNKINTAFQQKKITLEKKKAAEITSDVSNSDLEVKTKKELEEVRIFELLEDKAENSSFCSTSSTVIAFLQQSSTPLKHKALLHSATKHQISHNNIGDQTLEEIVNNTESNHFLVPKAQKNNENQKISQWEVISNVKNNETDNGPVLPYGTDIIVDYNDNVNQDLIQEESNVSLHVRFAEFNEYKTMSDTSSVSNEYEHFHDFKNQGVWSDQSETPDTSDGESILQELKVIGTNKSKPQVPYICVNKESDDSESEDETQNIYHQDNNQEDEEKSENDYDTGSKNDTISSVDTVIAKDESKSLFKSELLRKRLSELEHEIEIFRKESAALNILRCKLKDERTDLHEERIHMQRSMKEKEAALEAEKKKTESILQEEKKRLAREKTALESRLKDAYEKAQKSKQERQEIQTLREQLEELKEEYEQKENKWSAANARQRSQIRVLQSENVKLKMEIEQLNQKQKARLKRIINPNTRTIHQINKNLSDRKKISNVKIEEINGDEPKKAPQAHDMNIEMGVDTIEEKPVDLKKPKIPKSIESIARTRYLYENLLKDATEDFEETLVSRRHLPNQMIESAMKIDKEDDENDPTEEDQYTEEVQYQDQEHAEYHEVCPAPGESLEQVQLDNYQEKWSNEAEQPKSTVEKRVIKETQRPDGRIEYLYRNGNVKKVFPDHGLTKIIYYNGDVCETDKDGVEKYYYAQVRIWHTTLPDGHEILEYPNGQVERRSKDGTIEVSYSDGSVKITHPDGIEKWALNDGTIAETTADGDKIITFPNGQTEIHTKDHKRREYPDGTVKLLYLDGIQETRYANGRIRVKDKDGNLLMDTHQ